MSAALENAVSAKDDHQDISIRRYKPLIGALIENIDLTKPLSDRKREPPWTTAKIQDFHVRLKIQMTDNGSGITLTERIIEFDQPA